MGPVSLPVDWMKVGLVQETAEQRSIFPQSWISHAFLFESGAQPVQCCEELESRERGLEGPQPHHRMSRSEVSKRGWREGVGDEQTPQKEPKSSSEMCPPSPKGA